MFSSIAQAATNPAIKVGARMDILDLMWHSGPIAKSVLLLLLVFSVISWAIIFTKNIQLSRLSSINQKFLEAFWQAKSLEAAYADFHSYEVSSLAQVFKAGYLELQKIAAQQMGKKTESGIELTGIDNISRALRKASDNEIARMEGRTSFLATVGSTSPFIGLFGTVWGIMAAFQDIGNTGAASLAIVAPGISEALIATAIGLAAAIPAVMGYNFFVGKIKKEELEISNFNADFMNIVKRNFFRD